jgi:vacuolar-type H+-ATPase subunit H
MIATSIDGSNSTVELLSTLLADPTVYADKLKELTEATAENKKYVALVGPASEILATRATADADKAAAAKALADAKTEASNIVTEAKVDAAGILADAQGEAKQLVDDAKEKQKSAASAEAQAKAKVADAEQTKLLFTNLMAEYQAKLTDLETKIAAADQAKAAAEAERQNIIDKHQAFIEGL